MPPVSCQTNTRQAAADIWNPLASFSKQCEPPIPAALASIPSCPRSVRTHARRPAGCLCRRGRAPKPQVAVIAVAPQDGNTGIGGGSRVSQGVRCVGGVWRTRKDAVMHTLRNAGDDTRGGRPPSAHPRNISVGACRLCAFCSLRRRSRATASASRLLLD